MLPQGIDDVTEEDLNTLVANQVAESKTIEYKQSLPEESMEGKREFLADVSSFANASGGDLVLGIAEDRESGLPKSVDGLDIENVDTEISKLQNLVKDGVQPRIWGIDIRCVQLSRSKVVLVIRIPRSWSMPHRVSYGGLNKFYVRNSNGKHEMDVGELRVAFNLTETSAERIRRFREERISRILVDETPVPLRESARIVLHLISMGAFEPGRTHDITSIASHAAKMNPINAGPSYTRYNFDGLLNASGAPDREPYSYVQLFKSGIIEAVESALLTPASEGRLIPAVSFERMLIRSVRDYLALFHELNVELPILLFLSLLGVRGYSISREPRNSDEVQVPLPAEVELIDRDYLPVPEVVIERYDQVLTRPGVSQAVRPCFDCVWNACGWSRSLNYNDKGEWIPG